MRSSELVDCTSLARGCLIDIETKSRHYRIECLGGKAVRISGHPEYCPNPVPAQLQGSVDKEGILEWGFIGRGKRLLLRLRFRQSTIDELDAGQGNQATSRARTPSWYPVAMTNRRVILGSAGAALAQLLLPQAQAANPVVFQHDLPDVNLKGWSVTAVEVNYSPGQSSSAHRHPGITLVY